MEKESGHNSKNRPRPQSRVLGNKHLVTSICSAYWLLFMCTSSLFCPLKACGRRAAGNMIFQNGVCGRSGWTGFRQSAGDDHVNNGLAPRPGRTTEHWVIRLHVRLSETGCGPWLKDAKFATASFFFWGSEGFNHTTLHFPYRKPSQRLSLPASSRTASLADEDAAA